MTDSDHPSPGSSPDTSTNSPTGGSPSPSHPGQANGLPNRSWQRWVVENLFSFALALLLVFMIRSSVIEAFKIPSGSMIPTLLIGDHIFVNKFAYGIKLPFSDLVTDHPIYLIKREPPKRGDIVVFLFPKDESFYYIKRVIGVPGDTIEIRNKVLYINGAEIKRDLVSPDRSTRILKDLDDGKYSKQTLEIYDEHLTSQDHLEMLDKNTNFLSEGWGPKTVPEDSLFVMGDNRDYSNDSRFWGYVPMKNVKGKAFVIWLSFWVDFSEGFSYSWHPERIGTLLH